MSAPRPGSDRPGGNAPAGGYGRSTVAYALEAGPWRSWDELLQWLRGDGLSAPGLTPDELRGLRQDAERACARGAPFSDDLDRVWAELRR
ncbi:hypothetical protein B0I33_104454 [Prauserella shujinwangii]|uniref:Uncharacterized protein n=1 Tax=Prauserella shujinwangii TaxID=1453103 RepID=A0A2T0LXB1_9PSEU|nr:hypothetical protein [Prauserella shujinwangii]PRX48637.1 hypothetical protein B0I33_104454 [Prauserella shujinwangii]